MKRLLLGAALAAAAPSPVLACASCGCTLSSDWLSQGLVTQPGTTISLRYDYVPQTQLRSGRDAVDRSSITFPNDREIERYTDNHYLTAALDHQFAGDWGLNLQLPIVYRPHATTGEGDEAVSTSRTHGIGDARVMARWQGLSTESAINGLQFGLQLPTGTIHQHFRSGPGEGDEVDRGLQPGTGSVQLIAGAYRTGKLGGAWAYILQVQGQLPVSRRDNYKPGAFGQASAGVQYTGWSAIVPHLDLSVRVAAKDTGENSDTENSAGEQVYATPGITARLSPRLQAFGWVQLPLYQRLRGYQIAPRATVSVGLQQRL